MTKETRVLFVGGQDQLICSKPLQQRLLQEDFKVHEAVVGAEAFNALDKINIEVMVVFDFQGIARRFLESKAETCKLPGKIIYVYIPELDDELPENVSVNPISGTLTSSKLLALLRDAE